MVTAKLHKAMGDVTETTSITYSMQSMSGILNLVYPRATFSKCEESRGQLCIQQLQFGKLTQWFKICIGWQNKGTFIHPVLLNCLFSTFQHMLSSPYTNIIFYDSMTL